MTLNLIWWRRWRASLLDAFRDGSYRHRPREALHSVATRLLTEENLELGANNAHLESCVTFFKDAHVFVARRSEAFLSELGRHNYVTPTSYLELLATYKQVLALKRDEVGTLKNRLRVGLDKLIATAEQVRSPRFEV